MRKESKVTSFENGNQCDGPHAEGEPSNHHWQEHGAAETPRNGPGSLEPRYSGNLCFGVTLGIHRESDHEVFQFNEDRDRHTLIIGRTGAGKSNHIQQMERQDIRNGVGCFILAAHEDDALYPLSCVPEERLGDVVFIDAANPEYLPRMNPLDIDTDDPMAVSKAVEDVLELVTMDSHATWSGPRFEHYLRNGLGLILGDPHASEHYIAKLNDVFTKPDLAKEMLKYCVDESVYDFWTRVFPNEQHSNDAGEITSWFLAKISRFATDRTLKHIFGPGSSTIDMQDVVDNGKVFVAFVPESCIGSVAARTVAKWLVMQLRDAIMNRRSESAGWTGLNYRAYENAGSMVSGPEQFFVYVDEFAKFAGRDFEALLAESRKQNVGFVLSTQTLSQTRTYDIKTDCTGHLEEAVLGNVGSVICYPVGSRDAALLSRQFDVDVDKLNGIERYKPLARLCLDNQICRPGTLEVGVRPEPDNPSAPRRIAESHVVSGAWTEVKGAKNKGAFFKAVSDNERGFR